MQIWKVASAPSANGGRVVPHWGYDRGEAEKALNREQEEYASRGKECPFTLISRPVDNNQMDRLHDVHRAAHGMLTELYPAWPEQVEGPEVLELCRRVAHVAERLDRGEYIGRHPLLAVRAQVRRWLKTGVEVLSDEERRRLRRLEDAVSLSFVYG